MLEITFYDGTELIIPEGVIEKIRAFKKDAGFRNESGGIILGGQSEEGLKFVIKDMTLPSPEDDCGPYHYMRDKDAANRLIEQAWEESDGTVNYLGEWHTHPEPMPHPSYVDKNLMKQTAQNGSCLFDRAFMVILGYDGIAFVAVADPKNKGAFLESLHVRLCDPFEHES